MELIPSGSRRAGHPMPAPLSVIPVVAFSLIDWITVFVTNSMLLAEPRPCSSVAHSTYLERPPRASSQQSGASPKQDFAGPNAYPGSPWAITARRAHFPHNLDLEIGFKPQMFDRVFNASIAA